jgi:hypothetical protein
MQKKCHTHVKSVTMNFYIATNGHVISIYNNLKYKFQSSTDMHVFPVVFRYKEELFSQSSTTRSNVHMSKHAIFFSQDHFAKLLRRVRQVKRVPFNP